MKWVFAVLLCLVVLLRLPSLAEPAGGDQGLYSYVAKAVTHGGLPYRDAWDQKPPAVHYTYAVMYGVWHNETVVAATDLVVALLTAFVVFRLGRRLAPGTGAAEVAVLLFLLLANPAFGRMGGIWVRAQCESFIALLTSAALLMLTPRLEGDGAEAGAGGAAESPGARRYLIAGLLLGLAFLYKYNAAAYVLPAAVTVWFFAAGNDRGSFAWASGGARRSPSRGRAVVLLAVGAALPVAATALAFQAGGGLGDLWHATVTYNLRYSGETYASAAGAAWYLLTFPIRHARVDGLWFVGGLGCVVLVASAVASPAALIVPAWVAASCLAIAVNGARDLPQYFVQAAPLLALAAGLALIRVWAKLGLVLRVAVLALVAFGVARVAEFDKLAENVSYDARYIGGRMSRAEYLGRFGGQRPSDKFSALAVADLGNDLGARTAPSDRIFVFGFSGAAYVRADRLSASRFFWSRPVICGFADRLPGYGPGGLLAELRGARPRFVVLQQHDWPAERSDSAGYFLADARLVSWLRAGYALDRETPMYQVWIRR